MTIGRTSTTASNSTSPLSSPAVMSISGAAMTSIDSDTTASRVVLGQRVAQRLVARDVGAEARFEQRARGLAGTEAGDLHLVRELAERGVDGLLELVRRDGDAQADLVAFERFDGRREGGHMGRGSVPVGSGPQHTIPRAATIPTGG